MNISNTLNNIIKQFPFGFSAYQLQQQVKIENINLSSKQIKDYLYRSKNIFYDKKQKLFIHRPVTYPIINASIVAEELQKAKDAQTTQLAQQIAHKCLAEAKKGHDSLTLEIPQSLYSILESYGFKLIIINNHTKISWT